jgi:hypothetical protein
VRQIRRPGGPGWRGLSRRLPMSPVEGGCGEVLGGSSGSSHAHGAAVVIAADNDAGERGDGGFEFDSERDALGLGILRFHRWI